MKAGYSHIVLIVDRSGSMAAVESDVREGLKKFFEEQRNAPGEATITYVQFDSDVETVYDFVNVQTVEVPQYHPRGWTALYEAVGRTVVDVGAKLAELPEGARPEKVLVVIQTDGQENASREWTQSAVKALIEQQKTKYNWEFLFLGQGLDVAAQGTNIGTQSYNYSQRKTSAGLWSTGRAVTRARAGDSLDLTPEEQEQLK